MNEDNTETTSPQQTPATGHDDHEDGKLRAEAAKRRIAAREANERADAAEAEAADLRAQIAALKLSQARQQVTAKHPELTAELIERFAPEGIDADTLEAWADKALGLVVALRGEATVDADDLSDTERELAEKNLQIARMEAVNANEHVTGEVLDALCTASTPEGVAEWAAAFERLAGCEKPGERKPVPHRNPDSGLARAAAGIARQQSGSSSSKLRKGGLQNVAQKLTNR